MGRLTMTNAEMDEIKRYSSNFDCPVKAEEESVTNKFCDRVCDEFQNDCPFKEMAHKLKVYEDLEEQGLLIRLPCKVGDEMWAIRQHRGVLHAQQGIVSEMFFTEQMKLMIVVKYVARGEFGKTVFHTKEEAEKALERRKNGKVN